MKNKTPMLHMKGYERVMAIHKLKENIIKYGDRLGRKNKILNNIKKRNMIFNFVNLTINKINLNEEVKPSHKINLLNKKIQNNEEDYKNEMPINKEKIRTSLINELLKEENLKNENERDKLSNSCDYKIKETDIFSNIIKKDNSNNQILIDNHPNSSNKNNKDKNSDLIQNMKNYNSIKKNKTYNNFYNLLNKDFLSNNSNHKNEYQESIPIIKPTFIKNRKYKNIQYRNKTIIPKFRSLKLGTKPLKMKLNCKVIKLEKKSPTGSLGNLKSNDIGIKKRILFYNKYKKTKDMKLTKIKSSKSQNDVLDNEFFPYKNLDNIIIKDNTKNFGQQTINSTMNKTQSMNCNLLRIYSYIRLPNINRINYPHEKLNLDNNNCGINSDFYNNNYFYLKDIKNQSINKIFMINPFIRNRIINN